MMTMMMTDEEKDDYKIDKNKKTCTEIKLNDDSDIEWYVTITI